MGGMPSCYGGEWRGEGNSRANYDKSYQEIPKVPYCEDCARKHKLMKRPLDAEPGKCGLCGKETMIVGTIFQDTADKLKKEK
jgi:hypothetical protein